MALQQASQNRRNIMHDFKAMHRSNQPATPRKPTILEYIGGAFVLCASTYSLMYFSLVQLTGGF